VKQSIILVLLFVIFRNLTAQERTNHHKELYAQDSLIRLFVEKNPTKAITHAHIGYKQSLIHADSTNIAYFSTYLGVLHKRLSAYDSALYYYHIALEIQKKIHHTAGIAGSYNNIAFVYKLLGKYDLSVEYYLKALDENEKANNVKSQVTILNNIGNVFADQNQFQESFRTEFMLCLSFMKNYINLKIWKLLILRNT
jgi:tetratricopeptide (TPR) repeat protein